MFFLPSLGGGGAEILAVRLASGLRCHGITPVLVVAKDAGEFKYLVPKDVEVVFLKTPNIRSSSLKMFFGLLSFVVNLNKIKPDILVPFLPLPSLFSLLSIKFARHKPAVIVSLHSKIITKKSGLSYRSVIFFLLKMINEANRIIVVSRGIKNELSELIPSLNSKINVIYNIGKPLPEQLVPNGEVSLSIDEIKCRKKFLACGRLVEAKDYPTLLKAFSIVLQEFDAELYILGDGPKRDQLIRLSQDLNIYSRVKFLGFVDNPFAYMMLADIFVLSSQWEGFGNVIVEAMSVGLPVISTKCPYGPEEIIKNGVNGILVEPSNAVDLAAAMVRLSNDSELREKFKKNGLLCCDNYSVSKISADYAEVFRDVFSNIDAK